MQFLTVIILMQVAIALRAYAIWLAFENYSPQAKRVITYTNCCEFSSHLE